jgi:osmotically-inducible protein OsmY
MPITKRFLATTALVTLMAVGAAACTPVGLALGAGATAGIAATSEGGIQGSASDFRIQTAINDLWFKSSLDIFRKLNLSVDQGRVLITGVVQDPNHRLEAVRLAWQPRGVKQVINEIRVADSDGIGGFARDTWITTKLRTQMTFDRDIQSINYSIETVQGIVYLMGVARSQSELDHVIEVARGIKGVKQVISYVKMVGEPVLTHSGPAPSGESTGAPMHDSAAANRPGRPQPIVDTIAPEPDAVERVTLPP